MNAPHDPWDAFTQWKASAGNQAGAMQNPADGVFFLRTDTGFRVVNTSMALRVFIVELTTNGRTPKAVTGHDVNEWYPRPNGAGSISLTVGPDCVHDVVVWLDGPPGKDPRVTIGTGLHGALRSSAGWTL